MTVAATFVAAPDQRRRRSVPSRYAADPVGGAAARRAGGPSWSPSAARPGAATMVSLAGAVAPALERQLRPPHRRRRRRARRGCARRRARAQFYPKLTPELRPVRRRARPSALDVAAAAALDRRRLLRGERRPALAPRRRGAAARARSDMRLVLTQPLLRGFGPNATLLRAAQQPARARGARSARFELRRQRIAVQVTRAFYQVIAAAPAAGGGAAEPASAARAC